MKIVPKWVAPNALTLGGFLFTVLIFVVLSIYDYGFYASTARPEYPGSLLLKVDS